MTFSVTKSLASVTIGPDDTDEGPGTFSLILSTDALDRDGEIVEKGAFNPLPDHISMDLDHGMSVATTVGSGKPFYNAAGQLQVDGSFASTPLGQTTRTLVREGHIRTASVAMIPKLKTKSVNGGPVRVTSAEILNGAFTPVPANTTATVLSAKSVDEVADLKHVDETLEALREKILGKMLTVDQAREVAIKAGARNSATDSKNIQQIHDLVAGLGAICGDGSSEGKHVHQQATKTLEPSTEEATGEAAATATADPAAETADDEEVIKSLFAAAAKGLIS